MAELYGNISIWLFLAFYIMARINDFLSYIDFESMREYCMANGNSVSYAKGDYFAEVGRVGKYVGFV